MPKGVGTRILDLRWVMCFACRRVPAGDAADEQGRISRQLPPARTQRASPGDRLTGREGDSQLRQGGQGGSRGARACLVSSISRFLEPAEAVAATEGSEVEIVDARHFGGAYVLDELWHRLGIAGALVAAAGGRRLTGEVVERVLFALVAQRCLEPASKLACVSWVQERVAISSCPPFDDQAAYAAMDFLLDALEEIARGIFNRTANLLNLSCDVIFVDTSSTYWEVDVADEEVELATATQAEKTTADAAGGDELAVPDELASRQFSKNSKDHRGDLPQVVIAMAVTAEGVPIRCWSFPGTTSDQLVIRRVKDDLGSWMLNRVLWVTDSGFNSATNRAYLSRGGEHYIVCEKLRSASVDAKKALARPGRYHLVEGNLSVKEVRVGEGARSQRFVVCVNPEGKVRDEIVRTNLVAYLEKRIAGSDEWSRQRRDEPSASCALRPGSPGSSGGPRTTSFASTRRRSHAMPTSTASGSSGPRTTP